ncbi:TPA: hypothetical protein ACFRHF_001813 [Neisseria lactamica]
MNIPEENESIKNDIEINLLHSAEADSVETMMDLAAYGLLAMVAKHNRTHSEQFALQAIAGHMRKLLSALPETESLVLTGKIYRRLEDLIFKTYLPEQ